MVDRPKKELPAQIVIEGHTWVLMKPGLYMRNHIGEITASDGTIFDVSGSLNGLAVYLETPYDHPGVEEPTESMIRGATPVPIVGKAMYKLSAGDTIQALAMVIMELPDVEA